MSEKKDNELERKVATIESITTDMGNGSSWCSNCDFKLDTYTCNYFSSDPEKRALTGNPPEKDMSTFIQKYEMQCPNCESYLTYGRCEPYPFGGSDFL